MATTIDQLKSLFQKAKKKTLDATTIDEKLGQGLRSAARSAPVQSIVRSTASMVSPIANPMIAGATSANNYLKYRTSPTVVAQAQQNKVQFQKQLDYGKQNTYAPTFVPLVQQLSAKFPQIPNSVEKTARFIPDKIGSMVGLKPQDNLASNLIGGFARGAVEVLPETISGNQKRMDAYQGKFIDLTPQEKTAMQNENTGLMSGLLAGPTAKGFKPGQLGTFSNLMDKKVRFEIDDSGAKLTNKSFPIVKKELKDAKGGLIYTGFEDATAKLSDVLDHPKLFKQYPQLKDVEVVFGNKEMGTKGSWDGKRLMVSGKIIGDEVPGSKGWRTTNKRYVLTEQDKSTLLHEIQHAIQQKEGFARGGSPEAMQKFAFEMDKQKQDLKFSPEAQRFFDEQNSLIERLSAQGATPKYISQKVKQFEDAAPPIVKKLWSLPKTGGTPNQIYQRLAGEVESRAVQRRMDMPMSQRLATDPYQAEMTATGLKSPQDAIVRFDETLSELSTKGKMRFKPKQALTQEEINVVDEIIANFNKTKDLSAPDAAFIDRVLTGKAGANIAQIDALSPSQRLNEVAKFSNISERANGVSMSIDPSAKVGGEAPKSFESNYKNNIDSLIARSVERGDTPEAIFKMVVDEKRGTSFKYQDIENRIARITNDFSQATAPVKATETTQRMNEIGKFANVSERANGVSMSVNPSAKVGGEAPKTNPLEALQTEARTPKTVRIWNKSKFSNDGAFADIPVIRKEENITLYQGGKAGDNRQFWTPDKKYAEQFGNVKEKTGTFYKVDNGNTVTDVYVEAPTQATAPVKLDRTQLTGKQLSTPTSKLIRVVQPTPAASVQNKTLRVVPNQPEMPKVPQSAQTNQLPEQPRSVYSQSAQKPKVQTADSWKQLASDKLYSRETADARMADAFDSEMNAPEDFKGAFARFIGNKDAASTRGTGIASQEVFTRVPKEKANDVIRFLDGDMADAPSDVKAFAAPFKKEYERLLLDAQKAGVPVRRWNDYVPHFWKEDPQQVAQMFMSAKGKFKNAKSRTIPTYSEGISMGLTPKYTHPAQILESYAQGLERVKAGMSFIKELDDKGIIVPASVGRLQPGFKQIIAPGIGSNETAILDKTFVGNYYAPTKVADQINRLFTEQEPSAFAKPAAASAKFQDIYLSGGLPGTPINAFTFGQTIKETTAGRPISAVKAVVRSFSPGASNKYFRDKAPIIEAMQKNNIPVQTTLSVDTLIDAPSAKKTFGEKIGNAWTKLVNEPTFKRFMPALQIDMFEGVQKGALKAGKSQVEADALAAQTVKAFYGVTGTDVLAKRSPLAKDLMTTTLFAPRFRESMINFWINNAKALAHPGGANKYNTRFLLGAALTYAGYDALNYANTGNHLWENPQYKKDKAMIPVGDGTTIGIPLLPSVAYLPRTIFSIGESLVSADIPAAAGEAMGLLSPLSRPIADLVRNKDYFGKQIVPYDAEGADRFKAAGGYLAQQYSGHPYVRELTDPRNQEDPMYQRVSRALEAPLRFYDSKLDGSIKVQAADNSKPLTRVEAVKAEKEKFDKLGKLLDKYENNPEKAIEKAAEQGFSAEDVSYYGIAREDNDVKTAYVLDQLDTIDKSELIDSLAEMRKKVGDKLILADGVIDDLYDQDLITSAQKKYLKSLDYEKDPKIGKYALKKGGGKKGKKIKIGSTPTLKKVSIKAPQVAQMAKIDFKIPTAQKVPIRKASTSKPRIKLKDAGRRLLSVVR